MKKILNFSLIGIMILMLSTFVSAEEIDDITIYVDNELVELDTKPVIRNDRTLVPLRGVLEELGATVDWNKETKQVIVKNEVMEILLETDNNAVLVDGRVNFMDTKSMLIDDRTLVPLRFIAETLGYEVKWTGATHRIDINSGGTGVVVEDGLPTVGNTEALAQLLQYSNNLNNYVDFRFMDMEVMIEAPMVDDATNEMKSEDVMEESAAEVTESVTAAPSEDYSNTNNQTDGVEEGDITKTNGEYIFYTVNNEVFIIDSDPLNPDIKSTIKVSSDKGWIRDIYVQDNNLVIIGTSYARYAYPEPILSEAKLSYTPYYYTNNTYTMVYDFSDVEAPNKVIDMDYEGNYVSSRLIDDQLYMVTNKNIDYYHMERMLLLETIDDGAIGLYDYELKPKYSNNLTDEIVAIDYKDIYYFPEYIAPNYLLTVGLDLTSGESEVTTYLGSAETVYASMDHLYLSFTNYEYTNQGSGLLYIPDYEVNTSIYKFGLNDGSIEYVSEGKVPGTVNNQFSLNEHDGNLQIATTKGDMWNTEDPSVNNVYILDEDLEELGKIEGLAPGERIYSTRFTGDRMYMVTYRQVDPFFVIDASDPTNPVVLGELKIPGFSTYMHILDDNHVLGFGTATEESDEFTTTGGFKISLFDVTDPTEPVESKNEVIGSRGTYSELQYNHKALMLSLSKGIMGFPITVAETPYVTDFNGAYVYDLSIDDFEFKGLITHNESDDKYFDYSNNINRIMYIGNYVYSLSNSKMKVTSLLTMSEVSELELPSTVNRDVEYYLDGAEVLE